MNYRFLCVECNIVINIDDVFDLKGFIKVTASFERVIKNITRDTQFFLGYIDVDEWNAPNFSSCLERYAINGQECYPDHLEKEVTTCPPKLVFHLKEKLPVAAEDQINVVGAYSEARPRNGEFSLAWLTPTIDPTVTIRLPQGFLSSVSFGVPGEVISSSKIANSHTLKGAQFPGQEITVRWWPITT